MYDLIIIGGGPAGVAAGVYAARKKIKTALVTDTFGGQSLVSDKIGNWIGEVEISGFELGQKMEQHLRSHHEGIDIVEGDFVERVERIQGDIPSFKITTRDGKTFEAKTVLLTAGSRRRKLDVPGEKELEGKGVVYCSTCDAPLFGGMDVAVVGGGNAGLEAVEDLIPYANKIFLLHHRDSLKGDAVTQERIKASPKVTVLLNAETKRVLGDKAVTGLEYKELAPGEIHPVRNSPPLGPSGAQSAGEISNGVKTLAVQGVFVEIGIIPNGDLLKGLVALNERGEVVVDHKTQRASVPGVWAAGDATDVLYKQNNISAGDAVKAVLNINDYLRGVERK